MCLRDSNDLITAEELEKILSSDDEFNKSLFVDDEKNMSESFDDEEYVSDEPFNFENFFTEITNKDSEEISLNSEKEHENNNDIFSTNEINLDELLKFNEKDIPTELEIEDFNFSNDLNNIDNEISSLDLTDWNKDVISNNEEKVDTNAVKNEINENLDTDLLDLKIEDWNQHQNLNLDETTETISLVKNSTNTEDLEALNDLDWNKKIPNEIQEFSFEKEISQEETNKNNALENWSEFISASESLPKSDNKNIENLENLSLADEIKEFFENGEIEESNFDISDIQNAEPEFILPIENKEEDSIVESIVVDNQINENEDSKDFFVNFDPPVEKIDYEKNVEDNITKSENKINYDQYKFEPDISDEKIVVDKKITNDLQKFLAELKHEKEKLKLRKQNLEKRTSKVKSMFRDLNGSNGYVH